MLCVWVLLVVVIVGEKKNLEMVLAIVARLPHNVCVGNSVGTVCEGADNEDSTNGTTRKRNGRFHR